MAVTANGWPLKDSGLANFVAPNGHVTSVANKALAIVFAYTVYRWDTEIEPVTACYGNRTRAEQRKINPASMDSNHISATAIDVNGAKHPYEHTAARWTSGFSSAGLAKLREILSATGVLQTGLDFSVGYRDAMHVQVTESATHRYSRIVSQAQVNAAAKRIGDWVAAVQRDCGVKADKIMGPGTKKAIIGFQKAHGLTADGIWGPATQAAADADRKTSTPPSKPAPKLKGKALILQQHGITANQQNLVNAAKAVGLPLHIAAAFTEQESHGQNVFGNDAGGAYHGGGPVTQDKYKDFLAMVRGGHTSNGVGPLQITYPGYFKPHTTEVANLWKPYNNMVFGFKIIKASLGGKYTDASLDGAAQQYNSGSRTGAPSYGKAVVSKAARWSKLLGGSTPTPPSKPSTGTAHADTGQDLNRWLTKAAVGQLQKVLGVTADKIAGPATVNALIVHAGFKSEGGKARLDPKGSNTIKRVQAYLNQHVHSNLVTDGIMGKETGAVWTKYLGDGGKFPKLSKQPLPTKFTLPAGHAYAMDDGGKTTHSGVRVKDRPKIKRIQKRLNALGTKPHLAVDGIFGKATAAAVRVQQGKHKLTKDGQVGPGTWNALGL